MSYSKELSHSLMLLFADHRMTEEVAKAKVRAGEMSVNDYRRGLEAREAAQYQHIEPLQPWPKK